MFSRKKLVIAASTICLITVTLFLQVGVFANQPPATTSDYTIEAADYDVYYDCNRDGKVDMLDIFGCILRFGAEGDPVRTSILAVSHTAFNPIVETQTYFKAYNYLMGTGHFYAEVNLPHEANVTWMAVYLRDDNSDGYVFVQLRRVNIPSSAVTMAEVNSGLSETPGTVRIVDDTIDYPIVNNDGYSYHLHLYLPVEIATLCLHGVVIGYEYTP